MNGRRLTADIECFDCFTDERDGSDGHSAAEQETESASGEGEEDGFAEKAEADERARGSDGAQHADLISAANDGDGDGVVDEKRADH